MNSENSEFKKIEESIVSNFNDLGIPITKLDELWLKPFNNKYTVSIIMGWLPKIDDLGVKETLIRALAVPWARRPDLSVCLIEEFRKQKGSLLGYEWAIANTLEVIAGKEVKDDLIELISDKDYGKAREMLVVALGNIHEESVEAFLIGLLAEEDLTGHAIVALRKLRSKSAIPFLEKLYDHKNTWVRNEAKKTIISINKYYAKKM